MGFFSDNKYILNKSLTKNKPSKTNFSQLISEFKDHLALIGRYSPHTLLAYQNDLKAYGYFCTEQQLDWWERESIRKFLKKLFLKKYKNSTIYRYRSTIAIFFDYLVKTGLLKHSTANALGKYKRKITPPRYWSKKQAQSIIQILKTNNQEENLKKEYLKVRDQIITEILYGLGLRISELISLKVKDIDLKEGLVIIFGKGGRHELLPLTPRITKELNYYLTLRTSYLENIRKQHPNFITHEYLFCNHHGNALTVRGGRFAFQKRLSKHQVESINPHALRHSIAGHLLENGAGIREVQKILRHRSIATTQKYTHLSPEFLKTSYANSHPLALKDKEKNKL